MKRIFLIFRQNFKIAFIATFTFLICSSLVVPNDIKELNRRLKEKRYHATINMTLYSDIKMADTVETQKISIHVFNSNLHYKFSSFELYSNSEYSIVLDHNNKTILVNKNSNFNKPKTNLNFDPIDFDSLFFEGYNFEIAKSTLSTKTYVVSFHSNENEVAYVNFTFNPKELIPQRIFIKYSKTLSQLLSNIQTKKDESSNTPVLLIDYENFKYDIALNPIEYNYSHILTINHKKQVSLNTKYSNYKVYNYLITNN